MTLDVESVVHGGVGREESLRGARALDPLHLALRPSCLSDTSPRQATRRFYE
jgi:hypothetical protein